MPDYLDGWIKFLIQSRKGVLKLRDMLKREKDPVIEMLYDMQKKFRRVAAVFSSKQTAVNLVLNPESLAFEETARTIKTLEYYHLSVKSLVVNRVVDDGFPYKGYLKSQAEILAKVKRNFHHTQQIIVPFLGEEVRGLPRLARLQKYVNHLFE